MVILHIFHCACAKLPYFHSGLKTDTTIAFLDPDFLYVAKISMTGCMYFKPAQRSSVLLILDSV